MRRRFVIPRYNPVTVRETISEPQTTAAGRPVPRVMRASYTYNDDVQVTDDWEHPALAFDVLSNDGLSMDSTLFVIPVTTPRATNHRSTTPRATPLSRSRSSTALGGENMEEDDYE